MKTWQREYGVYAAALAAAGAAQHACAGSWDGVWWTACLIGANLFFGEVDSIADRNRELLEPVSKDLWEKIGLNVLAGLAECAPKLPRKLFWGNVLLGVFALGVGSWVGVVSVARFFVYPKWRRLHREHQRRAAIHWELARLRAKGAGRAKR
jgi:hypothetical protein